MPDISLAAINRIVKRADPNIRISASSKDELRSSIEDYTVRIAELAISIAKNAKRTTILPHDISSAKEQLLVGVIFHKNQMST